MAPRTTRAKKSSEAPAKKKLSTYQRKRDFERTPEPSGERAKPRTADDLPHFVIQRHRARRLHYDFRL